MKVIEKEQVIRDLKKVCIGLFDKYEALPDGHEDKQHYFGRAQGTHDCIELIEGLYK